MRTGTKAAPITPTKSAFVFQNAEYADARLHISMNLKSFKRIHHASMYNREYNAGYISPEAAIVMIS
eukprot:scaffold622102_cov34-Prasinocladus_malaysianus.AAC.1